MKFIYTFLLLVLFFFSRAQQVIKKTSSSNSRPIVETYHVLDHDRRVKHGEYLKTYSGQTIKGRFENNKRVGVWEYSGRDGQLELKIDFDSAKVLFREPLKYVNKYMIPDGVSWREINPTDEPVFLGGTGNIFYTLFGLQYPVEARRSGMQGDVMILVTITKDGKMVDEEVISGPGRVLNSEALRVIKEIPDEWIAARINGEYVDIKMVMTVRFKLN